MQLKYLFTIIALVSSLAQEARSQCRLPPTYSQKQFERTLFAITHNGHMELLLNDRVPVGATLHVSCSGAITHNIVCEQGNRFRGNFPQGGCSQFTPTTFSQIVDKKCRFQSYATGYEINGNFLELFRSCYNLNQLSVVYSVHKVKPFAANTVAKRPTCQWKTDAATIDLTLVYQNSRVPFFQNLIGNDPAQLRKLENSVLVVDRGHMVPVQDFMFYHHRCSTFRYTNAVPQFNKINGGNWAKVEDFITKIPNVERVITGSKDVLNLGQPAKPVYLHSNQLPVPKWIYKIYITNTNDVHVFLSYNNIFNDVRPNPICDEINCPAQLNLKDENSAVLGFMYCCNPTTFPNYVPELQSVY